MHKLLLRQLRAHRHDEAVPPEWQAFIDAVDEAYHHADEDRHMIERSLEISSEELLTRNEKLSHALDELKNTQMMLVSAEKMAALGQLVAGVAHEVNTPVGNAITAVSHLEVRIHEAAKAFATGTITKSDFSKFMEEAKEASTIISKNLMHAADVVRSFKRVALEHASTYKCTFNIKEYLDEVLLTLRPQLKKTKHVLTIDCDEKLKIYGEPGAYSHILTNLINNSIMHAYDEREAGNIKISLRETESEIIFTYQDDGKGIPDDNIKDIFNPFFTTKRGSGGTGLGLYILYDMVSNSMGGSITCHSEVGKGTTFLIKLPLMQQPS